MSARAATPEFPGMPERMSLWPRYEGKPVSIVVLKFSGGDELGPVDPFDADLAGHLTTLGRVLTLRLEVEVVGHGHELEELKQVGYTGNVIGTARLAVRRVLPPAVDSLTGEIVAEGEEGESP